MDDFMIIGLIC